MAIWYLRWPEWGRGYARPGRARPVHDLVMGDSEFEYRLQLAATRCVTRRS